MSEQNIELIKTMRTAIMNNDLNTIENLLENNPDLLHAESVFGNWIQEKVTTFDRLHLRILLSSALARTMHHS